MEVLYERCCGLDVHKQTVVACLVVPGPGGRPRKEVRTFGTTTGDLLRLADWLAGEGCTHVAMESTGVYWQPVWNLLEGRFALLLANAAHVKAVPGRKTDVKDAEWLADLLRHGLLRGGFVPDRAQRELRDLTRYRTQLVRARAAEVNRLQKVLEGANIKLGDVASDVMGQSARAMLAAMLGGETDGAALARLARGRMKAKRGALEQALAGRFGEHQRFLLTQRLAHIDFLDGRIAELEAAIAERLRPFEDALARLDAIPGVGRQTAEVLLAEIGADMSRFPTAQHLASWAGLCPGHQESAGKQRSGKTRKGSPWLRAGLLQAARAAARDADTALAAQYRRLVTRRGDKKAVVAVAHRILVIAYHVLKEGTTYQERAPAPPKPLQRRVRERALVRQLEALGYAVTLDLAAA